MKYLTFGTSQNKLNQPSGNTHKMSLTSKINSSYFLQVKIDVKLCFCSKHVCNHPTGELMSSKANIHTTKLYSVIILLTNIICLTKMWMTKHKTKVHFILEWLEFFDWSFSWVSNNNWILISELVKSFLKYSCDTSMKRTYIIAIAILFKNMLYYYYYCSWIYLWKCFLN